MRHVQPPFCLLVMLSESGEIMRGVGRLRDGDDGAGGDALSCATAGSAGGLLSTDSQHFAAMRNVYACFAPGVFASMSFASASPSICFPK